MKPLPAAQGHYYRKQLGCKSWVIAWSHASRFKMALRLIGDCTDKKLLDYGCGDGTFLAFAAERIREGWGTDIAVEQLAECRGRLSEIPNLHFCPLSELNGPAHDRTYDVVTCMETLEHCVDAIVDIVLRDLARLCSPGGRVVISVPIETGPTFLGKYTVRKIAALRGLSDYRYYENYSIANALKMIFATTRTRLQRPVHGEVGAEYHTHYGFNWRSLRNKVKEHFRLERTLFSPLGYLGGFLSSQAWFVCKPLATR